MKYTVSTGVLVPYVQKFKKQLVLAVAALFVASIASMTLGARAAEHELQCFSGTEDGYNGTCMTISDNSADIDTVDEDEEPYNQYAGVYYNETSISGQLIEEVENLSFDFIGSGASGGSPRFSIAIDDTGDGLFDGYAFVDTLGCSSSGDANSGTLDVINNNDCLIWYENVSYESWDAFVGANQTYRIASDRTTFVIVDQDGIFTLSNVQIGSQATEVILETKEQCKNGGWEGATAVGYEGTFKNQGHCVSHFASSKTSTSARNR